MPSASCSNYAQELEEVNGGNTDGIAALAGCLVGANLGATAIGPEWRRVESYDDLIDLASRF